MLLTSHHSQSLSNILLVAEAQSEQASLLHHHTHAFAARYSGSPVQAAASECSIVCMGSTDYISETLGNLALRCMLLLGAMRQTAGSANRRL